MFKLKRFLLLVGVILLGAFSTRAQSIGIQPQPQSVLVGKTATFSATVNGGPCRTAVYKNGSFLAWGPASTSTVTYTTPPVTLANNGTKYSFQFFGCTGGTATIRSQDALLTVTAAPTALTLKLNVSVTYNDGTPFPDGGKIAVAQTIGPANTVPTNSQSLGVFILSSGNISGNVSIDLTQPAPLEFDLQLQDSAGGVLAENKINVQPVWFQPSYTGLNISIVINKNPLSMKSFHLDFTP